MKLLRFILVLVVIAYAGWLIWPVLSPFLEGASPEAASMRAGAEAGAGGLPTAVFWIAAAVLYLVAALMLGAGNPRAAIAYFLGFIADAALRLALDNGGGGGGGGGGEGGDRSAEAMAEGCRPADDLNRPARLLRTATLFDRRGRAYIGGDG
mgnify:CR=1 FL=1